MSQIELHTDVEILQPFGEIKDHFIKKIRFSSYTVQTPVRTVFLNTSIPKDVRNALLSELKTNTFLESNKVVYNKAQYRSLSRILKEEEDEAIRNFIRVTESYARRYPFVLPVSFSRFPTEAPTEEGLEWKLYEDFLDIIHSYSFLVFVPSIRYGDGKTQIKYTAETFCKYVDRSINVLDQRNTKPIFVPIDIQMKKSERDKVLKHYASAGYTNIWIDFGGKELHPTNVSKLRKLYRQIKKFFGPKSKDIVVFLGNLKKAAGEENLIDGKFLPPSDIVGVLTYGDIIGAPWKGLRGKLEESGEPYWEKRGFHSEEKYIMYVTQKNSVIFDKKSYFYSFPDIITYENISKTLEDIRLYLIDIIFKMEQVQKSDMWIFKEKAEKISNSLSTMITMQEVNDVRKFVQTGNSLLSYLNGKEFFAKNERGQIILNELQADKKKSGLSLLDYVREDHALPER